MAITRGKKKEIIDEVSKLVAEAKLVVFVRFHALSVSDEGKLRKALRSSGSGYRVVKKTLLHRVLGEAGISGSTPPLTGEVALAYGRDDILSTAREMYAFQKCSLGALAIVGGIFEGSYIDASSVLTLATIPSREALYGRLAWTLSAPVSSFVRTLGEVTSSFVRCLGAIEKARSAV